MRGLGMLNFGAYLQDLHQEARRKELMATRGAPDVSASPSRSADTSLSDTATKIGFES